MAGEIIRRQEEVMNAGKAEAQQIAEQTEA
jgi:hypothetical protein